VVGTLLIFAGSNTRKLSFEGRSAVATALAQANGIQVLEVGRRFTAPERTTIRRSAKGSKLAALGRMIP
jgi:hypothetical protein